jgi:hypothetical protein
MHLGPKDVYRGAGGIGVPESPSLMYTTNLDCSSTGRLRKAMLRFILRTMLKERLKACVDCHGPGFDDTLKHWKNLLAKAENETNQRIFNVQKTLHAIERNAAGTVKARKAQNLVNEARHNYNLVLLGKGVHNIEYAIKLLNVANNKTEQASAMMDSNYEPRELRAEMTCTTLCHVGIEKRSIPFNDIKFSHATHTTRMGLACSDCHSPREDHGKTSMKNCAQCHHGKESRNVSCQECHVATKRLVEGKGGLGAKEIPSPKLGTVTCTDCHHGTVARKKDSLDTIKKRCIECHDESYGEMAIQWKATSQELLKRVSSKMDQVREEIDRIEIRGGRSFVYRKLYGDAEFNFNLVKKGDGVHNIEYAEELLKYADNRLDEALKQLAKGKKEVAQGKM